MPSLWFVMPVFGRTRLASICVRQLRRTCDDLAERGVEATAVLIGSRRDLEDISLQADGLQGFGWILRNNRSVSRKFNDGIQLACDPRWNGAPADYVVPIGSDDWVHADALLPLPPENAVRGFQTISFVREDGGSLEQRTINTPGGWGIRVYPRQLLKPLGYRPADEDRLNGCDTSAWWKLRTQWGDRIRFDHEAVDPLLVVDWKTDGENIHPFDSLYRMRPGLDGDPYEELAGVFPAESLERMRSHYDREMAAA